MNERGRNQRSSSPASSDEEVKKQNSQQRAARNKGNSSPYKPKKEAELPEQLREAEEPIAIEYRGKVLELGYTWKQISTALDSKIPQKKLAASIRLCLLKKFKQRVSAAEEEEAMQKYKSAMYNDS